MFGANKVSQSLIDAVNKVVGEETTEQVQLNEAKKRMLSDADLDETGFHKAAHAAKKANQTHFEFMGKKYPVTAKSHTEEYELDEEGNCVTPMKAKKIAKKEVKGHEKSMHHEEVEQIDELSRGSLLSYANKVSLDSQKHSKDPTKRSAEKASRSVTGYARAHNRLEKPVKEEVELEEAARLTPMYKKHVTRTTGSSFMDKAKSHGKNLSSVIKDLQGERDSIAKEHGYKHAIFHDKAIGAFKSAQKILAKEEVSELNFKDRLLEREMTKKEKAKRHEISGAMEKDPSYFKKKYGTRWKEVMYATATKKAMGEEVEQIDEYHKIKNEVDEISTDMLSGREHGEGHANSFKNFKVKIQGSLKTAHEPDMEKGHTTKASETVKASGGAINPVTQPNIGVAGHGNVEFTKQGFAEGVLDEATMTHITLGKKVKNDQGGHDQDVHHKGEKIGTISSYSHRTGKKYGSRHDASGDSTAGARSPEESIDDLRWAHAQHLKSKLNKEEAEQIDEIDANAILGLAKKVSPTAKMRGSVDENAFTDYKTDKKPSIFAPKSHTPKKISTGTVYTRNWSKKDQEPEDKKKVSEGKDPEMDAGAGSAPNFVNNENPSSSPVMKRIKEVTKKAIGRVKNEMLGIAPGNQTNGY